MEKRYDAGDDARVMARLSLSAILLVLVGLGILMLDDQHRTALAAPHTVISQGD